MVQGVAGSSPVSHPIASGVDHLVGARRRSRARLAAGTASATGLDQPRGQRRRVVEEQAHPGQLQLAVGDRLAARPARPAQQVDDQLAGCRPAAARAPVPSRGHQRTRDAVEPARGARRAGEQQRGDLLVGTGRRRSAAASSPSMASAARRSRPTPLITAVTVASPRAARRARRGTAAARRPAGGRPTAAPDRSARGTSAVSELRTVAPSRSAVDRVGLRERVPHAGRGAARATGAARRRGPPRSRSRRPAPGRARPSSRPAA